MAMFPTFRSVDTMTEHIKKTMGFYHPRCVDASGGFYHYFKDDGRIYDPVRRHLVSSTRFVFNYAMAYRQFKDPSYLEQVSHGIAFLRMAHRQPHTGGYAWQIDWVNGRANITDGNNYCYGLAFVVLAYAHAFMAGITEASTYLLETITLMDNHFWQADYGLYADQLSQDWHSTNTYRGQNSNMHSCEAMIAAYQATSNIIFLQRAETIAKSITHTQAAQANGLIWEHYDSNWRIDWRYNLDNKSDIFRPWGFQPGHFTEWAKLLVLLERYSEHLQNNSTWLIPTAERLFTVALDTAWDKDNSGICYSFAPDMSICDGDKYFWVQAESLAAAACLAKRTGNNHYWAWYEKIWQYSWLHFIDHQYGAWYRILTRDNLKISDEKSSAGKTDYHTMGACYEVLNVLGADGQHD